VDGVFTVAANLQTTLLSCRLRAIVKAVLPYRTVFLDDRGQAGIACDRYPASINKLEDIRPLPEPEGMSVLPES
jgi:hypothetical protein